MLYQPRLLDFSREILVFVHVPKTAGSSLEEALAGHVGHDRYVFARVEKIGKIHPNRLLKGIYGARKFMRHSALRFRGIDPLMRKEHRKLDLTQLRVLHGHITLGKEPKVGRNPVYVTLLRDPVDRFLSDYYYRFDIRAGWPEGKRERHSFWLYDVDRFVDYVYKRKAWTETNLQCLYLAGVDNFEAARKAVDECVFLAAPVPRLRDFLQLMGPVLNMPAPPPPRANIGKARQGKQPPSEESLSKIREMVSEDQKLFDYVSKAFDDLYAEFGQKAEAV
jgi:Sulfotransferase family